MQGGIFTLTAYDDVCLYLYTFKISRRGKDLQFPMMVSCDILTKYQIMFSSLPLGTRMLGVIGCFPSSPNPQAMNSADDVFATNMLRFAKICDRNPKKVIVRAKQCRAPRGLIGEVLCSDTGDLLVTSIE